MFKEKIKALVSKEKEEDGNNKKKIENLVVLIIILIITVIVINVIWNGDKEDSEEQKNTVSNKKLASENEQIEEVSSSTYELSEELENILSKIDGVGDVNVMITYSQTSQTIPLYNEDTSVKNTEESDTSGGTRKVTETDTKKDVIYKESNGEKEPITQSIISPKIEGAIVTAKGANDANIKAKIIQAVEAVTGLSTHKIQVFEMKS